MSAKESEMRSVGMLLVLKWEMQRGSTLAQKLVTMSGWTWGWELAQMLVATSEKMSGSSWVRMLDEKKEVKSVLTLRVEHWRARAIKKRLVDAKNWKRVER